MWVRFGFHFFEESKKTRGLINFNCEIVVSSLKKTEKAHFFKKYLFRCYLSLSFQILEKKSLNPYETPQEIFEVFSTGFHKNLEISRRRGMSFARS